ncbi:MAG: tetratricopeptide repeat protein [Planctomycetota bacterium]|jgi:serine/threonine protein kinase/Flp pilus assembly protein TadD
MNNDSTFGAEPSQLHRLFEIGLDKTDLDAEMPPITEWDLLKEKPGSRIGPYFITQVLGEGGMGIVYLAQQEEPVRRQVALKVIKPGMDSKRVIARFEAEKQVLALMQHTHIAGVYDAGLTLAGRPYFVMEYVKGMTITDYCDHHKLTIEERLGLLVQVCQAVQHAHQKGIIHRDIKPSNILVSAENDQAIPKIIDFGVAKATGKPLTERTLATEDTQLLGTPEYMSPEQVDMASEDIDTGSDIYSLGVLLYVLLTGVLPFETKTLRESGIENIRKTIRETEPKTPSTRLIKLGDEAMAIAQNRRMEIQTLARQLRKELEWIPLKAMRKERSERYRSASELADDIENYLKGTPLIAGPPTSLYRLKKFMRRNATLSAAVLAVASTLILGPVATTALYFRAEHQVQISEEVSSFLREDLLASVSPTRAMGQEVTIRSFLDTAAENLEAKFKDEPLVEASIRDTLGNTYRHLGDFTTAELHLERACQLHQEQLGLEDSRTLKSMSGLVWVYFSQGRCIEAEKLAVKAFNVSHRVLNEEHEDLLRSINDVAFAYLQMGRYEEAESLYIKMLETSRRVRGEVHEQTVRAMSNLSRVYSEQGRYDEAEQQYDKALPLEQRVWGEEHPFTLANMAVLARVYSGQGRYGDAEMLYRRTLEVLTRVVGKEHLYTLGCMSGLARVHMAQERYQEAEDLFNKTLEIARRRLREEHPSTLGLVNGLAVLHTKQKQCDEAQSLFNEALQGRKRELGEEHPDTLESKNDLAVLYKEQGDYDKAEPLLLEAVKGRRFKLGDTHPHTLESLNNLIYLYEAWNKPEKAEEWRAKLPQTEDVRE